MGDRCVYAMGRGSSARYGLTWSPIATMLTRRATIQGGHEPSDFVRQIEEEYSKLNQG